MSHRAWLYIWGVLTAGVVLTGMALSGPLPSTPQWLTFWVLAVLATLAHLFKARQANTEMFPVPAVAPLLAAVTAALAYVAMNHLLVGMALVLARGISWRESGILRVENVVTDLILLLMGYSLAVLWQLNPWL